MKSMISLLLAGLFFGLPADLPANAQKVNIGCQRFITDELISEQQANDIFNLRPNATIDDLAPIASANCVLRQEFKALGEPSYTELVFAVVNWNRCFIKVTLHETRITRRERTCV